MSAPALDKSVLEANLPPYLNSNSPQPNLFDGTTRFYTSYTCPFSQRVWITRNFKGLQDEIKLVPLTQFNRPSWYVKKVSSANMVPALEHNGKIIGESLDLIKYVDSNFEGPSLSPTDPAKKKFGDEMIANVDKFAGTLFASMQGDPVKVTAPALDYLESSLQKFDDGPFFLGGEFSLVDIVYIPFVERFQIFFSELFNRDFAAGRPKFATWIEEMNKIQAYKQTKTDPKVLLATYAKRFKMLPK